MTKTYTIKKGNHYSGLHIGINWKMELSFSAILDDSCIYDLNDPGQQTEINKLYGFSLGYHHNNSMRIGWRWNVTNKNFEILPYIYRDGTRLLEWSENNKYSTLITVQPGEKFYCLLELVNGQYHILAYKNPAEIHEIYTPGPKKPFKLGYYLHPYFGGVPVDPDTRDMKITIER